jgi:hypothetical protein
MKKRLLWACLLIIFFIFGYFIYAYVTRSKLASGLSNAQRTQAAQNILGHQIRQEKTLLNGSTDYKGKYFFLTYPASAGIIESTPSSNLILETFSLNLVDPKAVLSVMVAISSGPLDEYSGVRIRRLQKDNYLESKVSRSGLEGISFKKQDHPEITNFFKKDGKIFSFSLTSIDSEEGEKVFEQILSSLKFI